MARGAFPDSHPQHLGMPGMHGTVAAVAAMQRADLLIALGARFDDRVTGQLSSFAPDADDRARRHRPGGDLQEPPRGRADRGRLQGDHRRADRRRAGRARARRHADLTDVVDEARRAGATPSRPGTSGRPTARCRRSTSSSGSGSSSARTRSTPRASASTRCGPRSSSSTRSPRTWINSGGLGTMGFAVPAAMGAQVRHAGHARCGRSTATAASR